jgi:hypothetical protein
MKLLVVEDDRMLSELIRRALIEDGFAVDMASDGEQAETLAFAVVGKTASFSGKGNYGCVKPNGETYDGIGNQTILGWLEDNGEGSTATGPDRFWINMSVPNSKLLLATPASTNARPLTGGNVQVPQPSSGK